MIDLKSWQPMVIKSFLLYFLPKNKEEIIKSLAQYSFCEVLPSTNKNVLIITLESEDPQAEKIRISTIENLPGVESLMMTFGASV